MINTEAWAIKRVGYSSLVGDKHGRTLWKIKPTNALEAIRWRAERHHNKPFDLVTVKVKITEIEND